MANKRHNPEKIVTNQRQVEVLVGQVMARIDVIRDVWITEQTFYRRRMHYGGKGTTGLKELKCLFSNNLFQIVHRPVFRDHLTFVHTVTQ